MGSIDPLPVFFHRSGLRAHMSYSTLGQNSAIFDNYPFPVINTTSLLASSSPALSLPCRALCWQCSVGDKMLRSPPAPDHLSLALALRDRVVLGYHVSAGEGSFFPPSRSLPLCSEELQ